MTDKTPGIVPTKIGIIPPGTPPPEVSRSPQEQLSNPPPAAPPLSLDHEEAGSLADARGAESARPVSLRIVPKPPKVDAQPQPGELCHAAGASRRGARQRKLPPALRIIPRARLRTLRLERLKEAIFVQARAIIASGYMAEDHTHPAWAEIGRLLYEAATKDFKAREIPPPLRSCPWLFVLAELATAFPDIRWNEPKLAELVQLYLATLAASHLPCKPKEKQPLLKLLERVEGA